MRGAYLRSSSAASENERSPVLDKRTQRAQQMELSRVLLGGQVHQLHVMFEEGREGHADALSTRRQTIL